MVKIKNNKKGQAAIEFLMTYGWMLLVVLIVGALIFSFVDFGSLLPNKIDLNNNLKADPTGSIAYSKDAGADKNTLKLVIRYNGASRVTINSSKPFLKIEAGGNCTGLTIQNLDAPSALIGDVAFLNGHTGIFTLNCSTDLLKGDSLIGSLSIPVTNPKTSLDIPSVGQVRLQISG